MSAVATTHSATPVAAPVPATVAEVEGESLRKLVHHREFVDCDTRMEDVHRFFSERQTDFVALVRDGRVRGICGRAQLAFQLGSRFGFALNARNPAHQAGVKSPLVFQDSTPVREVLQATLGRHDDEFYEDIALVDGELRLIGLIPVEALVRLQSRLVNAQLEEMRRQNVELFAAGHALRQAQALSAGLFASNAVGVALLASCGKLQSANRRLGELLNLGAQPSSDFSFEKLLVESERPAWRELLEHLARSEHPHRVRDFELEVPGLGRRFMHFSFGWIAETSQVCVCVDDITQQREIERRLQHDEKQKLLDTLAGGVAHELNNKLTPVLGYADLLGQAGMPSQMKYIDYIRKGVQESANIIRQLLRLAKPETGAFEVVDLRDVVRETAAMLQFEVREARAQLLVDTGPAPLLVHADAAQLKQVVMNLALNGLHAMEGAADPVLRLTAGQDAGDAFMAVRDNGAGISPEVLGRIFDPFFTTKGPKGTGLGLSICRSIARQHGGEIKVASRSHEGATFTVRVPALPGAVAAAIRRSRAPFALEEPRVRGLRRILVIEDEVVIRNFLKEAVRKLYDCTVDEATDGREALRLISEHDYDLILSDIRMPVMTGPEFYLRLRETAPAQAGRVVFLTGHMGQSQLQDDIARWGVPVLEKPFTMDRLSRLCASRMAEPVASVA